MNTKVVILAVLLALFVCVAGSAAFSINSAFITIDRSGDATITAYYDTNLAEAFFIQSGIVSKETVSGKLSGALGKQSVVTSISSSSATATVENFAEVNNSEYTIEKKDLPMQIPMLTITFPDKYSVVYKETWEVPEVSHTLPQ